MWMVLIIVGVVVVMSLFELIKEIHGEMKSIRNLSLITQDVEDFVSFIGRDLLGVIIHNNSRTG